MNTPATALFTISDDETASTSVMLCAEPGEVVSGTGPQEITVTAEINGREFDEDQTFTLILNHNRESDKRTTAERDVDFDARGGTPITIKAGEINNTGTVTIDGFSTSSDDLKIGLTALEAGKAEVMERIRLQESG